jgi:hypothetical protein
MAQSAPGRLPAGQSWPDNLFGGLADMANPPFFFVGLPGNREVRPLPGGGSGPVAGLTPPPPLLRYQAFPIADPTAVEPVSGADEQQVRQYLLPSATRSGPRRFSFLCGRSVWLAHPYRKGRSDRIHPLELVNYYNLNTTSQNKKRRHATIAITVMVGSNFARVPPPIPERRAAYSARPA